MQEHDLRRVEAQILPDEAHHLDAARCGTEEGGGPVELEEAGEEMLNDLSNILL